MRVSSRSIAIAKAGGGQNQVDQRTHRRRVVELHLMALPELGELIFEAAYLAQAQYRAPAHDLALGLDAAACQCGQRQGEAYAAGAQGIDTALYLRCRLGWKPGRECEQALRGFGAGQQACVAENLRLAVAKLSVPIGSEEIHITASFGVAAFPESQGADELMTAADLALYSAKRHGKDRVVTVNPESQ